MRRQCKDSIESTYSWLVVFVSLGLASLSFGAVTSIPILMQPMVEDLGWPRATLGLAHALAMVAAGTVGFAIGYLADRISFAVLSITAGLATGIGLMLSSVATEPWQLYAAYALLVGALGQGTFFGPITANVSRWFDRNRAFAMAIVLCGQSVGGLTVPIALRGLAEAWGWRDAMAAYGLLCLVLIVSCSLVFAKAPPKEPQTPPTSDTTGQHSAKIAQLRLFTLVTATLMLLNAGSFIVIAHLVAFGEEQGLPAALSAGILSILLGVTLVSRLGGGALLDRTHPGGVLVVCIALLPVGILMIEAGSGSIHLMMAGAILLGLGYGGVFPALTHIVRATFPSSRAGTWISAMFLFGFLAAATGSWLGGMLRDISGTYSLSLIVALALTAGSLGLALASGLVSTVSGHQSMRKA
ncbi:MAG: MFS transporter [Ectothiorhodospiraceae bacterium]|nr:MFS transporter [Ectothiorhodospiraceae bacterium]